MTARRFVSAVALIVGLLTASSAAAQIRPEYEWTPHRPDAFAPTGVLGDHLMEPGDFMIAYIYENVRMDGNLSNTDSMDVEEIFDFWTVTPVNMTTQSHTIYGLIGITENLTIMGKWSIFMKRMENWTPTSERDVYLAWESTAEGIGDPQFSVLWSVVKQGSYRAHISAGVSIPLGQLDEWQDNPYSFGLEEYLGYPMQIGSGTWDFLPGFTLQVQDEQASVGMQGKGTIRFGEQLFGWSYGNHFAGTIWAAYKFSEYVSASARVEASSWGDVQGWDSRLDPLFSPDADPYRQGGNRVELPIGLNITLPEGNMRGFRVSAEGVIPLHQSLNGPQLAHDWSVRLGIYRTISLSLPSFPSFSIF